MEQVVQQSKQRAQQYMNIDGFNEVAFGGQLLWNGLSAALMSTDQVILSWLMKLALPVMMGIFYLGVLPRLKERITYRRTGYIAFPAPPRWQQILYMTCMLIGFAALLLLLPLTSGLAVPQWAPLAFGLFLALMLVLIGRGLARFWGLAGLSVLLGVGITLQPSLSSTVSLALFCTVMGSALLISGSWVLYHYLGHNPPADEAV